MALKLAILRTLKTCDDFGRMMSRDLLKDEVTVRLGGGRIGDGEFESAMGQLQDGGYIKSVKDGFSGDELYSITNTGKAQL